MVLNPPDATDPLQDARHHVETAGPHTVIGSAAVSVMPVRVTVIGSAAVSAIRARTPVIVTRVPVTVARDPHQVNSADPASKARARPTAIEGKVETAALQTATVTRVLRLRAAIRVLPTGAVTASLPTGAMTASRPTATGRAAASVTRAPVTGIGSVAATAIRGLPTANAQVDRSVQNAAGGQVAIASKGVPASRAVRTPMTVLQVHEPHALSIVVVVLVLGMVLLSLMRCSSPISVKRRARLYAL